MYCGCGFNTVLCMQAPLVYMILKTGVSQQPLQQSYKKYGNWVTHSWIKTLWEKLDLFMTK